MKQIQENNTRKRVTKKEGSLYKTKTNLFVTIFIW